MKKFFIGGLMMLSVSAFAGTSQSTVDLRGLTEQQIATLATQANSMKAESAEKVVEKVDKVAEKVDTYADVSVRIGKMLSGAAKEVGIAVNEFVKTPVGMLTAGLILWHYMGGMIVHVVSGWAFLIISFSLLFWYSRRAVTLNIEYDIAGGRNWLGKYPVVKLTRDAMEEANLVAIMLGYLFATVISLWIMFSW